jgi:predicted RecA/RadA family phage recombinase
MKNQVSDGDVVTLLESALTHPTHTDGLADAGDPVLVGALVGVCTENAAGAGESVDVATSGIFNLSVVASAGNNAAVAAGDKLFIDDSTAALTKDSTKTPYGIALGAVGGGNTGTIPVKVTGF